MSDDIRLSTGFFTHHKTIKLERRFGLIGVKSLINLWMWTAQNRPTGILEGMTEEDLEIASAWPDVDRKLIPTLVELHWLDVIDGVYHVHGWAENQPWIIGARARKEKARKANAKRWGSEDVLPQASLEDATGTPKVEFEDSPSPLPSLPFLPEPQEKDNIAPPVGVSELEPKRESKRFIPPSLEEITNYLTAKNSPIDPETFHAHYEANGWVQGSGGKKVKNWKACVTTWEKRYAKDHPPRPMDISWHQYRDWSTRYLTRRRAIHPDDTPEPTQDIVDAGAQWLGEWICEDGFSEPQIKAGIVWLLEKPRRCHHVKHLGDLGLYSQGVGGNLGTWCVNGAMGMQMPADPFNPGPMDGGPPRDIA